ncbi:hypothetical protein EA677_14790 [Acinetobacter baumannii]|nr:hypothetical protein EA677_14790 [Acinetobacter baumannii]
MNEKKQSRLRRAKSTRLHIRALGATRLCVNRTPRHKSRVGFSLQDNVRYGVEFAQPIALVWLAVHQDIVAAREGSTTR